MQLAQRYESPDAIPEAMRELFVERDGAWHFDWSQVEGTVDPADVEAAQAEIRAEREAHRETKFALYKRRSGDRVELTPEERAQRDEYQALVEQKESLEFKLHKRTEAEVQRIAEEIAAREIASLEEALGLKEGEIERMRQELAELKAGEQQRVETDARLTAIKDALPRFAFEDTVEADLVWHALEGPDGLVAEGERVKSTRGESVVEWVERLARSRPHWSRNARRREAPRSLFK